MKIARKHILAAIEHALDVSGPVEQQYKKYVVYASPYRQSTGKCNTGIRVTWQAVEP